MKKTMVYFTDEQYYGFKRKAVASNRKFAEVVREAADQYFAEDKKNKKGLYSIIGMFHGGPPHDTSTRVDEILQEAFRHKNPHD